MKIKTMEDDGYFTHLFQSISLPGSLEVIFETQGDWLNKDLQWIETPLL